MYRTHRLMESGHHEFDPLTPPSLFSFLQPNPANPTDQTQKEFPEKKMSIPQDLIPEILSHLHRLPAKSLVRFQCVSKSWFAKINDPGFIQMHHDNSRERRLLLQIWNCRTNYLDYYLGSSPNENGGAVFPPFHEPYGFSKIIDCCNGLVCIRTYHSEIVIWNPSIRKYKLLPSSVYAGSPRRNLGFGYDPVNNDHKVVSIDCFGSPNVCFAVEVYSLKANSWSDVDDINVRRYCRNSRIFFGPVYLNGALYYLVETGIVFTVIRLLSFHLTTERFREQTPTLPVGPQTLEVLGGSLYVSTYERGAQAIVLWLMKERSWIPFRSVLIFEFDFQLEMPLKGWRVVLWSKDGQEFLMEMDYGYCKILKYDIKEKTRFIGHFGKEFWSGFCVGSLFLLDGDSVH